MLSIRDCLGITYIRNVLIYRIKNTSKLIKQGKIRSSRIIETLFGFMFILETNGIVIVGKPRLKNWVFDANLDFLISIFLLLNVVDLK